MDSSRLSRGSSRDSEVRSQFRRRAGLTLFELGQRVGKSAGTLSQWERGQVSLSVSDIERIAVALQSELAKFPASLNAAQIVKLLSDPASLTVGESNGDVV
jgi:transcriptional regulator with XRE-family HTH domain